MNELRWILIGFGFVLVAGIYLWSRRTGTTHETPLQPEIPRRPEPQVSMLEATEEVAVHGHIATPAPPAEVASIRIERRGSGTLDDEFADRDEPAPLLDEETLSGDAAEIVEMRGRLEPTYGDHARTAELPVTPAAGPAQEAPTLSLSDAPPPRRIERRKILALRLTAGPTKIDGARLLGALKGESLVHGKYDVFHRLHTDGASVFSIASMIEPGTFDVAKMPQIQYSGITLFAQLPGPVAGMYALNELVACAKRLHQTLGGTLQDDRGIPLTVHRIERMRQEVREFERPGASSGGGRGSSVSHSASS
jgi:cell division protein ZipA